MVNTIKCRVMMIVIYKMVKTVKCRVMMMNIVFNFKNLFYNNLKMSIGFLKQPLPTEKNKQKKL